MMTPAAGKTPSRKGPQSSLEQDVVIAVLRAADALQAGADRLFKEHQLSSQQYNVLRILRGAGEPLPSLEVAARMINRLPDITRLIDRLVQGELVSRSRSTVDRRVTLVSLTPKARRLLARFDAPLVQLHSDQLGHMSRADLRQLATLLNRASAGATH